LLKLIFLLTNPSHHIIQCLKTNQSKHSN